jgi:hypothetical protein
VDVFGLKTDNALDSGQPVLEFSYDESRYEVYGDVDNGQAKVLLDMLNETDLGSALENSDGGVIRDVSAVPYEARRDLETSDYARGLAPDSSYRGRYFGDTGVVEELLREGESFESQSGSLLM